MTNSTLVAVKAFLVCAFIVGVLTAIFAGDASTAISSGVLVAMTVAAIFWLSGRSRSD